MKTPNKKMNYISLFSGAGVGCYGFSVENFDCVVTNEIIERRLKIQEYNNVCKYPTGYISGDIQDEKTKQTIFNEIKNFKQKENINEIDVVIATPPCQGMSVANHKKKDEKRRNSLVVQSIEITKTIKPKYFVFENVRSFLNTVCTDNDGVDKKIKEAIEVNLGGIYNILFKVINFKEYGSNSSRTRTLVIGTRKDLIDITPYDLFPNISQEKTLKQVIGELPVLNNFGEINKNDFYHNFRPYPLHMIDWIKDLKEGQSAFDNTDINKKPHKLIDGKKISNQNKNGDKYRRCIWNNVAPCVHTRNDQLASQSTIHPRDNRVFSIRELMKMMTIPDDFKWLDLDLKQLNSLSDEEKKHLLKKNEVNIRQCIGEAVPTEIFRQIAVKIQKLKIDNKINISSAHLLITKLNLSKTANLVQFITENKLNLTLPELFRIIELANAERQKNAAYYTRQDICFSLIKELPDENKFQEINIIEPSVGAGNFLPLLIKKYQSVNRVNIDVVDIDNNSLILLKELLKKIDVPTNIRINFINQDFLLNNYNKRYDVVIGNPPFGKITKNPNLISKYKLGKYNKKTNNIFSYFIEEALKIGNIVALISPKSLLSAPEFNDTRELLSQFTFNSIFDYGEKGFVGVKIETIGFVLNSRLKSDNNTVIKIESNITNKLTFLKQRYIMSNAYPVWLLYRDNFFDEIVKKLNLDIFTTFRDRKITKKITKSKGAYRVLKSRNIGSNEIININGYDCYVDDVKDLAVAQFLNNPKCILIPNLTYNPRASFLPPDTIADGSVAFLLPKNGFRINNKDLLYYSTDEFRKFYMITRNLGTRSLNIDKNSVYFFGILKKE